MVRLALGPSGSLWVSERGVETAPCRCCLSADQVQPQGRSRWSPGLPGRMPLSLVLRKGEVAGGESPAGPTGNPCWNGLESPFLPPAGLKVDTLPRQLLEGRRAVSLLSTSVKKSSPTASSWHTDPLSRHLGTILIIPHGNTPKWPMASLG